MIARSLVLFATVSFVLGGASAQGHDHATGHVHANCGDVAAHSHDHDHHHHGPGADHAAHSPDHDATDDAVTGEPEPSMAGGDDSGSCCGKYCSSVVCVSPPSLAAMKRRPEFSAMVRSQVPEGIGPAGLKRPPRTIRTT